MGAARKTAGKQEQLGNSFDLDGVDRKEPDYSMESKMPSLARKSWKDAERRRAKKFKEIMRYISKTLGTNVGLKKEAKDAIDEWEQTVEMEIRPRDSKA